MNRRLARTMLPLLLLLPVLGLFAAAPPAADAPAREEKIVYVATGLPDEGLLALSANLAAGCRSAVLLLDSPESRDNAREFLAAFQADRVVPVAPAAAEVAEMERALKVKLAPRVAWERGPPTAFWETLFPKAEALVLCPAEPRGRLLQAACLAGTAGIPLWVSRGGEEEANELRLRVKAWEARQVLAVGETVKLARTLAGVDVTELRDEAAVARAHLGQLHRKGRAQAIVLANPFDQEKGSTSALAPWVAVHRKAALLLTNEAGDNATALLRGAVKHPELFQADTLVLAASPRAIPPDRRPNPLEGKDQFIEMEPFTPQGTEPATFATGRLFHEDRAVMALMLARRRLVEQKTAPLRALVVGNPTGGLPMLEVFSRHVARELGNGGYQTTGLFGEDATRDGVRRLLPRADLFFWEGHHETLVTRYGLPGWPEPLPSSVVFLESCLALNDAEAGALLRRGAVGAIGSSTRTYSGSGGAFTLAFTDALVYDDQTVGGALRQAKNFLLAYALLKEKRLGDGAKLTGANLRSAWAFTLWGDPTVKLPRPPPPAERLPPVRCEVRADRITLIPPEKQYDKVTTKQYQAQIWPNARLAGLVTKASDEAGQRLVPFLFAEVRLPDAPAGKVPRLGGTVASNRWVFTWDARRRTGYLLAIPSTQQPKELRFRVEWADPEG